MPDKLYTFLKDDWYHQDTLLSRSDTLAGSDTEGNTAVLNGQPYRRVGKSFKPIDL